MTAKRLLLCTGAIVAGVVAGPLPQIADPQCTTYIAEIQSDPKTIGIYAATATVNNVVDCAGCALATTTITPYWLSPLNRPAITINIGGTTTVTSTTCSETDDAPGAPSNGYDPCIVTLCRTGTVCQARNGRATCVPRPSRESQRCGTNVCDDSHFCCNRSCGVCAPIGGACTQQFCGAALPVSQRDEPQSEVVRDGASDPTPAQETQAPALTVPPSSKPSTQPWGELGRVPCGTKFCKKGLTCCNSSCSICTPKNGACILMMCGPLQVAQMSSGVEED